MKIKMNFKYNLNIILNKYIYAPFLYFVLIVYLYKYYILIFLIYSYYLYFNDVLLCEDHPNDSNSSYKEHHNTNEESLEDIEDRMFDFELKCSRGSTAEQHARVYYDRLLKLNWREELMSKDLNDLTSPKDKSEWTYLNKYRTILGWDKVKIAKYFQDKRYEYKEEEKYYLNIAYRHYDKRDKWLYKYEYLNSIDLSKYKLPESARHPHLVNFRYPK